MGIFRRISQWLSQSSDTQVTTKRIPLHNIIEQAHRAQYAESYDEALELLQEAYEIAEKKRNTRTQIDINLSRADILIMQGDYETARFILNEIRDDSEARLLNAPLAYALCSLGVLEQRQGNLDLAQSHFEKARETANAINTDGASGRATGHLGDIYLQQGNASYAVYLLEDAIDKLDRSGDRELLGYFLGCLGKAQSHLGQKNQGEHSILRGSDVAKSINHTAQIRELTILAGNHFFDNNDYRHAYQYFEEALTFYSETAPPSRAYVILLAKMSRVAFKLGDNYNAEEHAKRVLPIAEVLEDSETIAVAKAILGLVASDSTENDSLSYLQDAANYYHNLDIDPFYIDILRKIATAQRHAGDEEQAIQTLEDAISVSENMPNEVAKTYSELATYYADKRQLQKAIETWQLAIKGFEEANQTGYIASTHCDIALMNDQLGDGRMAQREYGIALEMLGQIEDSYTRGIILANVAAAYSSYGDLESAEDFFQESIQIARRNHNIPAEVLRRCNYGRLLVMTNRPEHAIRQLALTQERSSEHELDLQAGIVLGNMALAMILLEEYEAANLRFQQSLTILSLIDATQWRARGYANWADFAVQQGDTDLAKERYDIAFKFAQEQSLVDVLIQTVIGRVNLAIDENNLDEAENNLNKITPTAKRQGYQQLLALLHQAWSKLYAKQGKNEQAWSEWHTAERIRNIMYMSPFTPDWL